MASWIKRIILIISVTLTLAACAHEHMRKHDPYNNPDAQRSRAQGAQSEMHRDTNGY